MKRRPLTLQFQCGRMGLGLLLAVALYAAAVSANPHAAFDPLPSDGAVVTASNGFARFTVLTAQLIRMEFARDGVFEDRPSFTFVHRKLPVPHFETTEEVQVDEAGASRRVLLIRTPKVELRYVVATDPTPFTSDNLQVSFAVTDGTLTWYPGLSNVGILPGTIRTLDHVRGMVHGGGHGG